MPATSASDPLRIGERAAGSPIYGMQTWLALPDGKEEIDPAFEHVTGADLPMVEGDGVSARVRAFPPIPGDNGEFIPLPEFPKTVSYP